MGFILLNFAISVFGVLLITIGILNKIKGKKSLNWPHVYGKIIKADIYEEYNPEGLDSWYSKIEYTYKVKEKKYKSKRIMFGFYQKTNLSLNFKDLSGKKRAAKFANEYAKKIKVPVFYNPQKPFISVLKQGTYQENKKILLIGTVLLMLSALLQFILV